LYEQLPTYLNDWRPFKLFDKRPPHSMRILCLHPSDKKPLLRTS
jgi:hypothetical protein